MEDKIINWLKSFPTFKIGFRMAISGRANLDKTLWDNGAVVRVYCKYFLLYYYYNKLSTSKAVTPTEVAIHLRFNFRSFLKSA